MRIAVAIMSFALVVERAMPCTEVQIMAPTGDLVVANALEVTVGFCMSCTYMPTLK